MVNYFQRGLGKCDEDEVEDWTEILNSAPFYDEGKESKWGKHRPFDVGFLVFESSFRHFSQIEIGHDSSNLSNSCDFCNFLWFS